jgi:hypothetical protein
VAPLDARHVDGGFRTTPSLQCPLTLLIDQVACMLNFELTDDPTYESGELQWFDDDAHGTGMLVFLCRRADRRLDYYVQPGLDLDRAGYELGGGTGMWTETVFDVARLRVTEEGVDAAVRFTDVDGRVIDVRVDDRDGRRRRRGGLLAPVSAGIERPNSLLLVWMPTFDLVRVTATPPVIRIGGRDASIKGLPGARLHRRHLIKYAAPVVAMQVNRAYEGSLNGGALGATGSASRVAAVSVERAGHRGEVALDPPLPDVTSLVDGTPEEGRWTAAVDSVRLTGGRWSAVRAGDRVELCVDVRDRWQPGPLPWLMRLVTTVAPIFRRWPTTYRWRATLDLGPEPEMTSRWERTG